MREEGPMLYILRRAAIGLEQAALNSHLTDIHGMNASTKTGGGPRAAKGESEDEPLCD